MNLTDLTQTEINKEQAADLHEIYADSERVVVLTDSDEIACGYFEIQQDGTYYVISERNELITESRDEAAQWLFDHWIKYL